MSEYNKRYKVRKNAMRFVPFLLVMVVIAISIGYASTAFHLFISDTTAIVWKDNVDIRLAMVKLDGVTNGGTARNSHYEVEKLYSDITLPSADSSVTFEVSVINLGNVEMGLGSISGLPNNLDYSVDGYILEATLCDSNNNSKCTLGSVTTFRVTVNYDENGYDGITTAYNLNMTFDFIEMLHTARIGNTKYLTIQEAIDAAPSNNTETTVVLLRNTYERIKLCGGKNIVLDMANLVLHNKEFVNTGENSGDPVVEIFGDSKCDGTGTEVGSTFKMINGTIRTEANQSAINVEPYGRFEMTGGSIIATGNKQAVYVKTNGTAEISGTAYLSSMAVIKTSANNYRATVHNVGGNVTITGGTIESVGGGGIAITNESIMTIGTNDGNVSTTVPLIKGNSVGMRINANSTVNFYDGIVKGQTSDITGDVTAIVTGYGITHSTETIDGNTYHTAYLSQAIKVTFDPDGGTVSPNEKYIVSGGTVGAMPTPTKTDYVFLGWYNGNTVGDPNDVITQPTTYTAHWIARNQYYVARITSTGTDYMTITAALNAATGNGQTEIELIKDTSEKVTVAAGKNILFNFGNFTLSNSGSNAVITNSGTLEIASGSYTTSVDKNIIENNGTLTISGGTYTMAKKQAIVTNNGTFLMTGGTMSSTSTNTSAINNSENATATISGGSIIATGKRQAVYNNNGTVTITGTAFLSAAAEASNSSFRGTVQNLANSTLYIYGGTIISTYKSGNNNYGIGVFNQGTAYIGDDDGTIHSNTPIMQGTAHGIRNAGTLYFSDGIAKGITAGYVGTAAILPSGASAVTSGTETIGTATYHTYYIQ